MTVSPHWGQLKVVLPLSTSLTPHDEQLTAFTIVDLRRRMRFLTYNCYCFADKL